MKPVGAGFALCLLSRGDEQAVPRFSYGQMLREHKNQQCFMW